MSNFDLPIPPDDRIRLRSECIDQALRLHVSDSDMDRFGVESLIADARKIEAYFLGQEPTVSGGQSSEADGQAMPAAAAAEETASLIEPGQLAAVQFDDWFYAPDGQQYRVAFGPVTIIRAKELFGFEPRNSANWYAQVGYGEGAVLLAGCRIHSAVVISSKPVGSHVYAALPA